MKRNVAGADWMQTCDPASLSITDLRQFMSEIAPSIEIRAEGFIEIRGMLSKAIINKLREKLKINERELEIERKLKAELDQRNKHLEEQSKVEKEILQATHSSIENALKIELARIRDQLLVSGRELEAERRSRTELEERSKHLEEQAKIEKNGAGAERLSMEAALRTELAQMKAQLQTSEQALEIERKSKAESPMFRMTEDNFFSTDTESGREKSSSISSTSSYVEVGMLGEVAEA